MSKTSFKNFIATILLLAFLIAIFAFTPGAAYAADGGSSIRPDTTWYRTAEGKVGFQVINTPVTYDYVTTLDYSVSDPALVWDNGTLFNTYIAGKTVARNFASWPRLSVKGTGLVDQRRFHTSYTAPEGKRIVSARVESKDMGSIISINDNIFIFINGKLWYGGSGSSPENISRRDKTTYPETHGWNIDMGDKASMAIAPTASAINVDVLAQDYDTGGGMSQLQLIVELEDFAAVNDSYATPYNTALAVSAPGILSNDLFSTEGIKASLVDTTTSGALTLKEDGSFVYTPNDGFTGTDTFTYRLLDSNNLTSNIAKVTITVGEPPITPPTTDSAIKAVDDSYFTPFNTKLTTTAPGVKWNDTYTGDGVTASLIETTAKGSLTLNANGGIEYTPNNGFSGTDKFTYKLLDGELSSNVATVTIIVGSPETPPTPPTTPPVEPTPPPVIPTPEPVRQVTLTTSTEGQGTVLPGPGASSYSVGTTIQLNPQPAQGWEFTGWKGDSVDSKNQIYMDSDKSVTAVFKEIVIVVPPTTPPAAPVVEEPVVEETPAPETAIEEEPIPQAPAALPQTGGIPATLLYGLGGLLSATGLLLKRRKK